jgi:putative oxidoreductase
MASYCRGNPVSQFIYNRYLSIAIRLLLGAILLYASWSKIFDPSSFAQVLWNYKLFPIATISPLSHFVPWLEAVIGLALISGIGRKGAALLATGLLLSFMLAISIDLARDISISCGCFSSAEAPQSHEQGIWLMKLDLLRDLGFLLLAAHVLTAPITWRQSPSSNR